MSEEFQLALSMIGTLLLMVAIFVGAFFVSKWVAKRYQAPGSSGFQGNMEVLERVVVGKDQCLLLVKVTGRVFLLGVTPHQIEKIEEMDPDAIVKKESGPGMKTDFLSVFKDAFQKQKEK